MTDLGKSETGKFFVRLLVGFFVLIDCHTCFFETADTVENADNEEPVEPEDFAEPSEPVLVMSVLSCIFSSTEPVLDQSEEPLLSKGFPSFLLSSLFWLPFFNLIIM